MKDYFLLKPLKYGLPDHERVVSNQQLKSNLFWETRTLTYKEMLAGVGKHWMSDLRTESCGGLLGNFAETSYKGHKR